MDKKRIVITGVGVVAPNGIGKEEFWTNCLNGVSGIKPITLFDVSKYRCKYAGEISNFQPEKYLGHKGLRNLDRTTLLALVAAKLALEDGGLADRAQIAEDIGVVLGTTMGSLRSISEFDQEALRVGPRYVSPGHVPNTVINSPASQIAIRFDLQGPNASIASGFGSSLEALDFALEMVRFHRARIVLVGGVEELCFQTFLGFYQLGMLAGSRGGQTRAMRLSNGEYGGFVLGEGAGMVVIESLESALERGAHVYAEVVGVGTCFDTTSQFQRNEGSEAALQAMQRALTLGGDEDTGVDFICSSVSGNPIGDAEEERAICRLCGPVSVAASALKAMTGETFSASGALSLVAALGVFSRQAVFPTVHLGRVSSEWDRVDVVTPSLRNLRLSRCLVNAFGPIGIQCSAYLRRT